MAKRNFDHRIVHGVVTELSLIKKSGTNCHYFQVQLSDGTKSIKVIMFDPSLRPSMDTSQKDQKAINLTNSRVPKKKRKEETQPQNIPQQSFPDCETSTQNSRPRTSFTSKQSYPDVGN